MIHRLRAYIKNDADLVRIAIGFFLLNQFIELVVRTSLGKPFTALCDWDCGWYSRIIERGYDPYPMHHAKGDAANWAFFPAFPLAAKILLGLGLPSSLAAVITSKFFFACAIYLFIKFARMLDKDTNPVFFGCTVALHPYAIYGNTGYTESLFLTLTSLFFLALQSKSFLRAGSFAAILTATRLVGLAAVPAFLIASASSIKSASPKGRMKILTGLLLIPLGLAFFMAFLYFYTGDALAFSHIQRAWERAPGNPLDQIIKGFYGDRVSMYWSSLACFSLFCSLWLAYSKRWELSVFVLICTIVPLSTGLWSLPRYIMWQAPVLFVVAQLLSFRRLGFVFIPLLMAGYIYMLHSWFTQKWFVI